MTPIASLVGSIRPQPASGRNYPAFSFVYSPNGQVTSAERGITTSQASLSSFAATQQQSRVFDALGRLSWMINWLMHIAVRPKP